MPSTDPRRELLRRTLATLAYRGTKVVTGVSSDFGAFRAHERIRPPLAILAHIGDLLEWAASLVRGQETWKNTVPSTWDREVDRFFEGLATLDALLGSTPELGCSDERLFQGPIADALTHIGQIAILRRAAGQPVKGENYFRAEIATGMVGRTQPPPVREFE